MKRLALSIVALAALLIGTPVKAQEFFDTSNAEKFFTFGARLGFNTSNRTFPAGNYTNYMFPSWGIGFNAGVIANINFKEYLTIQPGFFYESRSSDLINIADYLDNEGGKQTYYEKDHLRAYYFTIPIMGIVKFNIADHIKWMVEFGPYFQICLKQTGQNNVMMLYRPSQSDFYAPYVAQHRGVDLGLKMGTGLHFYDHYYVGVHYLAGLCNVWKLPTGGRNKSWMFTVGYDF